MIRTWYIGFVGDYKGRKRGWFDFFTCKDFKHVLMFGFDADAGAWIVFDPAYAGYEVSVYAQDDDMIAKIISFVPIWLEWDNTKRQPLRTYGLSWCVPAVCRVLGFRSCALRPKALYRDLVKHGAKQAFISDKKSEP